LHLPWHNMRFRRSRRELLGVRDSLELGEVLGKLPPDGVWRCRVLYGYSVGKVEILPYRPKRWKRLAMADFHGDYTYKYADRKIFDDILENFPGMDDLILCREGLVTDTTVANIALRKGNVWYTPSSPILRGTTRERLLEKKFLKEDDIPCSAIGSYDELALMNAMIGFRTVRPEGLYAPEQCSGGRFRDGRSHI